jgi:hypothetical protein
MIEQGGTVAKGGKVDGTSDHTTAHKIAGLHQIAGSAVHCTIGEFRIYGTDGSVNRKSLNTYWT